MARAEGRPNPTSIQDIAVDRVSALTIAVVALATLFMLQGSRVFVGYLVFVVDQSERVTLGLTALGVFLAPALVILLLSHLPVHRVVSLSVGLLLAARIVMQVWEQPTARLLLGALCIVAWGWLIISMLGLRRSNTALGVLVALALDIMLRMGSGSIDLPWMPDPTAHLVTGLLVLALASALYQVQPALARTPAEPRQSILPLLALGPALALHHIAIGNLALGHSTTGQDRATVWVAMLAGVALGYFALTIVSMFGSGEQRPAERWLILIAAVGGGFGLWLIWNGDPPGSLGLVLAPGGFFVLLSAILSGRPVDQPGPRYRQLALVVTVGLVLHVALIFVYYTFTGLGAVLPVLWLLLSAAALWSSRLTLVPFLQTTGPYGMIARLVVLLAFVLPVAAEISAAEPEAGPASGAELTVMIYNIQSGFGLDRTWDLSETARVIAAEDPDVVVLNEVSRGWLVTASSDQLVWLSRELDMPYVWGPASDDDLWGNAVLSRVAFDESAVRKFASTQNLKRSAVGVALQVNGQQLWVFGTHLDNPSGAGAARMEQVEELLEFWDGREPAIIMGDLNAEPDDDVLQAFAERGFSDPGRDLGPNAFTSQDDRRIDYILVSPGIEVLDISIPDVSASDHKPVVATIRVGD